MKKERGRLRDGHQAEPSKALVAAPPADGVRVDPADWNAYGECFPPGNLMFTLRHRLGNPAAMLAFSAVQCAVTDPASVLTEAGDRNISNMRGWRVVQYVPQFFPGAPPVRSGVYRFVWTGQDAKGIWHEITRGSYEVPAIAANHPGTPQPQPQPTVPPDARGIRFMWSRTTDEGDGVASLRWS